jgi:hypothetical protein
MVTYEATFGVEVVIVRTVGAGTKAGAMWRCGSVSGSTNIMRFRLLNILDEATCKLPSKKVS